MKTKQSAFTSRSNNTRGYILNNIRTGRTMELESWQLVCGVLNITRRTLYDALEWGTAINDEWTVDQQLTRTERREIERKEALLPAPPQRGGVVTCGSCKFRKEVCEV